MEKDVIVIVLGNRMNDDGTITKTQEKRLKMAIELDKLFNPKYFILSGGVANKRAVLSEAEGMYNYLVDYGFDKERLIMEKDSLTTVQNAQFSIPIAKKLGAKMVIVCSSPYHFADPQYKAMESFVKELEGSGISLMTYCQEIND